MFTHNVRLILFELVWLIWLHRAQSLDKPSNKKMMKGKKGTPLRSPHSVPIRISLNSIEEVCNAQHFAQRRHKKRWHLRWSWLLWFGDKLARLGHSTEQMYDFAAKQPKISVAAKRVTPTAMIVTILICDQLDHSIGKRAMPPPSNTILSASPHKAMAYALIFITLTWWPVHVTTHISV